MRNNPKMARRINVLLLAIVVVILLVISLTPYEQRGDWMMYVAIIPIILFIAMFVIHFRFWRCPACHTRYKLSMYGFSLRDCHECGHEFRAKQDSAEKSKYED